MGHAHRFLQRIDTSIRTLERVAEADSQFLDSDDDHRAALRRAADILRQYRDVKELGVAVYGSLKGRT